MDKLRTYTNKEATESAAVWEQLLVLAEGGDIRAIKLYYDMLEKKQAQARGTEGTEDGGVEQMAAIRRAVFGDAAVDAAARAAAVGGRSAAEDTDADADPDGL